MQALVIRMPQFKDLKIVQTRNCLASGHADLWKRLTAIHRSSSRSFPLYTTFGAFSPCSDTILSVQKPDVATLNWSKLNSLNPGNASPLPFSNKFQTRKHKKHTVKLSKFYQLKTELVRRENIMIFSREPERIARFYLPRSDESWRFDLRFDGHQHRDSLEQRAPIGY